MIRKNYTFANSAEAIRQMLESDPSRRKAWEEERKTALRALREIRDDVHAVSGWGHDFVCPDCLTPLTYEMRESCTPPPGAYLCPHCKKTVSGQRLDEAWVSYYRSMISCYARQCAVGVLLGDEACRAAFIRYFDFYADRYAAYEPHGIWVGKGKVLAQSLDESIWLAGLAQSVFACRDCLPPDKLKTWYGSLFLPAAEFLFPQANRIHNISLWIMCAVGSVAVCFDNKELLARALDSRYGIREQIRQGFTEDGLWREGSVCYHYYSLQGMLSFFSFYAAAAPEDPIFSTLGRLYTAPLSFSHDGFRFQTFNDGWYPQTVSGYLWQMTWTGRFLDDPLLDDLLLSAKARGETASLGPLFDYKLPEKAAGCPPKTDIELLTHSNFAVFRSPLYAILKSGVLTAIHMHCDYLSLTLPPFSDDIGTPSYGHPMLAAWYHRAPSHNTVTVDGTHPDYPDGNSVVGTHIEAVPGGARAVAEPGQWRGLTRAERTLTAKGDTLVDETVLEGESGHCFDWFFHSIGTPSYSSEGIPASLQYEMGGYQFFETVEKHASGVPFEAVFTMEDKKKLVLTVPDTAGIEIFTALSPSNPPYKKRNTLILRAKGKSAAFCVRYRIIG